MTRLQRIRTEKGYSQSELATLAGVNVNTLQNYEIAKSDIRKAQAQIVWKIAQALDCEVGDLFD